MDGKTFALMVIGLGVFISCASRKDKVFNDRHQSSKKIEEVFELEKKGLDKFKVTKIKKSIPVNEGEAQPTPFVPPSKRKKNRKFLKAFKKSKIKKGPPKKERVRPTRIVANQKKEEAPIKVKEEVQEDSIYPAEYPEDFKLYDKNSEKVWNVFKPKYFPGEEHLMVVKYLGMTAGHVRLTSKPLAKINEKIVYHFVAQLKSANYYSYIYSLEDKVESFIEKKSFLPLRYSLIQRESGQSVDDLQLFDMEKLKTFFWYKRLKKGKIKKKEKEGFIPSLVQDSFSILHFIRGLPLKMGDTYEIPIVTRAKIWILKLEVAKYEEIEVAEKRAQAIKIKAQTHYPGVLKKRGDILFWYSNDRKRKILKFRAKVKIGSVSGDLLKYTP